MAGMSSRPVTITQVYVQETEPTDTRDGILWVDTTVNPPKTKVYDADTGSWEPVATKNVHIQDTAPDAPGDGEIWVDTSLTRPRAKVYDAGAAQWNKQIDATEFGNHKASASAHHAKPTGTDTVSKSAGYTILGVDYSDDDTSTWTGGSVASGVTTVFSATPGMGTADGIRYYVGSEHDSRLSCTKFGVIYEDGTEEWLHTGGVTHDTWHERNFTEADVAGWKAEYSNTSDFGYNSRIKEVHPHQVSLPAHSHNLQ